MSHQPLERFDVEPVFVADQNEFKLIGTHSNFLCRSIHQDWNYLTIDAVDAVDAVLEDLKVDPGTK